MKNNKLVSCIIIFSNEARFLSEAIESIILQSYKKWELILVDDGSTDESTQIAMDYSQRYPGKIFYYDHESHNNLGMSASRNLGIRKSKGEYIAFLDADDVWMPKKLKEQMKIMKKFPEAYMVYGRALLWYSWNDQYNSNQSDYFCDLGVKPDNLFQPPKLFFLLIENKAQTPMTSNVILRKEIFNLIGGFEESFTAMYEDQVFFSKVNLNFPVFISSKHWLNYRQHELSCTARSNTNNYWKQRRVFLKWLSFYLSGSGLKETFMMKKVKGELLRSRFPTLTKHYFRLITKIRELV